MVNYVVAIPSYKRAEAISEKTLKTLKEGGVPKSRIYIFVANKAEAAMYEEAVDPQLYNEIIVGKLGLINQRKFINKWFKEGQYIISLDDDVEEIEEFKKYYKEIFIHDFSWLKEKLNFDLSDKNNPLHYNALLNRDTINKRLENQKLII